MPELPEVETVVRTLNQLVKGRTITYVRVQLARIIQRPEDSKQFEFLLQGQKIEQIERRGKFIRFLLADYTLVSHLRMEGRYGVYSEEEREEKHTHVIFGLDDGSELRYKDVRQFGTMHLFEKGQDLVSQPLQKLGLEPLADDFTFAAFHQKVSTKTTKIKPLLLNQEYITGLGNIYVDEALFRAGIHPERSANELKKKDFLRLYEAIKDTLHKAVEAGGSSIKSYVNGQGEMGMFQQQLQIYGRKDQPCYQCATMIQRIVVGGRGTHFCVQCQHPPKK